MSATGAGLPSGPHWSFFFFLQHAPRLALDVFGLMAAFLELNGVSLIHSIDTSQTHTLLQI